MVKTKLTLNPAALVVPTDLSAPELHTAALAWVDFALELWRQEAFSGVNLAWWRDGQTNAQLLTLTLDSSSNSSTRAARTLPDAPAYPEISRRAMLDNAVRNLLAKTSPELLWAAVANSWLERIQCFNIKMAWHARTDAKTYPAYLYADELMSDLVKQYKLGAHPWQ